jgi:hypothetical protein
VPALDASVVAQDTAETARQPKMLVTDGSSTHGKSIIATLVAPVDGEADKPQRNRLLDLHTPKAKRHVASYLAEVLEEVSFLAVWHSSVASLATPLPVLSLSSPRVPLPLPSIHRTLRRLVALTP